MYRRWIRRRTRLRKPLKSVCPALVERSPSVKVQFGLRPSNFRSLESIHPLEKLCSSSLAPVAMRSELASDRYGSRISEQALYGAWILAASRRLSRSEKSRSATKQLIVRRHSQAVCFAKMSSDSKMPRLGLM